MKSLQWIRFLLLTTLSLSLGACSTMRPYKSGRMGWLDRLERAEQKGQGGDRSWLKRTEPRLTEVSQDRETKSFEKVRLLRWKRVADSIQLSWPLKRPRITSHFGERGGEPHDGVDLRARVGTPVHASHEGRVLYAGGGIAGYGNLVVLRHPSGLATVYAHNSRIKVKRGQWVRRGQWIASSGASGRASGPHVHFEVRAGSRPLNPMDLIGDGSLKNSTLASLD